MLKLRARAWLCHALFAPGQHTAKRRRTCTRQSRSCLQLLPNNHRFKNRLRFHRITVMSLWPQCLARPVVIRNTACSGCSHAVNKLNAIRWVAAAMRPFAVSSAATCFVSSRRSFPLHSAIASTLINSTVHTHTHTPIQRMFVHSEPTWHFRTIPRPAGYIAISFITPTRLVHSASAELNAMN